MVTDSRRTRFTLSQRLALLIAVLLGASAVITIAFSLRSVQTAMFNESSESVSNIHTSVATLISVEYDNVEAVRQAALEQRRAELKDVSQPLISGLDQLVGAVESGQISQVNAQERAKNMLRNVRFGNDDYFFTYNTEMTAIAHPDTKFQGQNLIDMQDADGKFVLREIRDIALNEGSGYIDYQWVRLNETEPKPKIGYVFHYKPWDWIIGTGVYVDDIDAAAQERLVAVQDVLAASFSEVTFSNDGFFFIVNRDSDVVVSPSNRDLTVLTNSDQGRALTSNIVAIAPAQDGELVTESIDVALRNGETEAWEINISTFTPLEWILVSAVPASELNAPGLSLALQQALVGFIVLIIGLAGGLIISRRIVRPVSSITRAAQDLANGEFDPTILDSAAQRNDEVGDLARTFRDIGVEIVERERKLREQVAILRVEIDKGKVETAVSEITDTEYFRNIQSQAEEFRRRHKEDGDRT